VGRARLRWLEDAVNDLRELNVKRWRQKENNREEWIFDVIEDKVLKEPQRGVSVKYMYSKGKR
jgi:hypothetical protein